MELKALALFLAHNPQSFPTLPDYSTIDGQSVSHSEGEAALRSGHALLVGGLLVGVFGPNGTGYIPASAAA